MTNEGYLKAVVEQQSLSNDSDEIKAVWAERKKVEDLLISKFKDCNPIIRYGGSKAKGTMIRESYDLDIICYFEHDDVGAGETLEEIFNNVKKALESQYLVIPKTSALRIESRDTQKYGVYFHIDVVPGRFVDDKHDDTYLHLTSGQKKYLKTNLQKHIDHVKNSGLADVIKLVKYWKIRRGLQIRTFILELLVIEVLKQSDATQLNTYLKDFWTKLKDNIDNIKLEDPANPTGNDLSELFNESVKTNLSAHASMALKAVEEDRWQDIFGKVDLMSDNEKLAAIQTIRVKNPDISKPWHG